MSKLRNRLRVRSVDDTIESGTRATGSRTRTYVPLIKGRTRHWTVGSEEIIDPHYNWTTHQQGGGEFVGRTVAGEEILLPANSPDLVYHVASQVRGWCFPDQGRALYRLAAESTAADGAIVEVGSAWGLSATWTAWGIRHSTQPDRVLHCVDTFADLPARDRERQPDGSSLAEFQANADYAGTRENIRIRQGRSDEQAASWDAGPIGQIYIDAWHTYKACRDDHLRWEPHLAPGAIVAFDDCSPDFPGVLKWQRELAGNEHYTLIGRADRMLMWRYKP